MSGLHAATEHRREPALATRERTWSHAELHGEANAFAQHLALPHKGLAFLFCQNTAGTVLAWLAAWHAGIAVALFDAALDADARAALVERYRPDWIFDAPPRNGESVARIEGMGLWRGPGPADDPPLHPDLALLLSTSGSTGSPKLVRLSRDAVVANARSIAQALEQGPDDRPISSLPLHYAYGLSVLNSHLVCGGCTVLTTESPVQRRFWRLFAEQACTSYAGVPVSYQLLARLGIEDMDLPTLRTLTQAGGRLDPALVQRFDRFMNARGGRFAVMYGQTEATARISVMPRGSVADRPDAVGRALPGGQLLIDAGDGPSPLPDRVGEVVYRGPNVMMGYAQDRADLARGDDLHGQLATGDIGWLDDQGFLYLRGRSRRVAKVFGHRINLDEVEARLSTSGPTAVLGGDDQLLAFCAWGEDDQLLARGHQLALDLGLHHRAIVLKRVDHLPRTASGKVDYAALSDIDPAADPAGPGAG